MKVKILIMSLFCISQFASAAIGLDRTRVIFSGKDNSTIVRITNNNKQYPYLAQGWIEDQNGKKINSPFTVIPPIQRVEPGMQSMMKIQGLPVVKLLPQDRESIFYFNLREVPPRSDKPNTLQLALQTKIKMFYRPESLLVDPSSKEARWAEKMTLSKNKNALSLHNPTPYYISVVSAGSTKESDVKGFMPIMIAPYSQAMLHIEPSLLGNQPVFTYIDDYGARRQLKYSCSNTCVLKQA